MAPSTTAALPVYRPSKRYGDGYRTEQYVSYEAYKMLKETCLWVYTHQLSRTITTPQ